MKKFDVRFFIIVIVGWGLDFITKILAVQNLSNNETIKLVGDFIAFRLVYNTGGVFGIAQGNPFIFHIMMGIAIIFLLVYYIKTESNDKYFSIAIASTMGGALGNFTDRFFREGVVDFIDMGYGVHRWPTYNVADAFISAGGLLLVITLWRMEKMEKEKLASSSKE